jgi:hypothetical protein
VKGKVTFNGKPLAEGRVTFFPTGEHAKGPRPEGPIEAGGFYTLTTRGKEGAPAGKYRAVIAAGPEDKTVAATIDPRYCDPGHTPLEVEVTENNPDGGYDLDVKSRVRR